MEGNQTGVAVIAREVEYDGDGDGDGDGGRGGNSKGGTAMSARAFLRF